jgi:plastocyanin
VHHALKIPGLDVMIDAMPGRTNVFYMHTGTEPGVYLVQCLRFCGAGHGDMNSRAEIFEAGTQPLPFGDPPAEEEVAEEPENDVDQVPDDDVQEGNETAEPAEGADRVIEVELDEYVFIPAPLEIESGEVVELVITNIGLVPHDLTIGVWDFDDNRGEVLSIDGERMQSPLLGAGETARLVIGPFDEPFHIWCTPHMPSPGMWTNLMIDGEIRPEEVVEPRLPAPGAALLLTALGGLFVFLRRRDR